MSMTVEVHVRGLALCFAKRDVWNAVFVCDPHHSLNFSYAGGGTSPLHAMGRDREITFSAPGLADALPTEGPGFGRIFNLAADYAHGPNVLIEKRVTGNTDVVTMKVPAAAVGTYLPTENNYYVQDAGHVGAPVEILPPVAKVINATFEVMGDLTMTINDINGPSTQPVFTFPYVEDGSLLLEFDNDCGGNCIENDFLQLYDVVQDPSGRKFVAGQVKVIDRDRNGFDTTRLTGRTFDPQRGNCDPMGCEPSPGA